jgi:Zn-dependent membrane protease YugP
VAVVQAVISAAAMRLAAETSRSWLDLLNFMRIFRQWAIGSGP